MSGWDILDASAPDDTIAGALDSKYRNLLETRSESGPSPPLARPRQPGVLIGLIGQSDLPVLSHDPRNSMLAERSVFGHSAWKVPDGVSVRTFGDMLVLEIADGVSADDDAVSVRLDRRCGPGTQESGRMDRPGTAGELVAVGPPDAFVAAGDRVADGVPGGRDVVPSMSKPDQSR